MSFLLGLGMPIRARGLLCAFLAAIFAAITLPASLALEWVQSDSHPPGIMRGSVASNKTHVYLMGGFRNNAKPSSSYAQFTDMDRIYLLRDTSAETFGWELLRVQGDIPSKRYGACAVLVDNKIFLYGGFNKDDYGDLFTYILDLDSSLWTRVTVFGPSDSVPSNRMGHGCVSNGRYVYMTSGRLQHSPDGGSYVSKETWKFSTDTHKWILIEQDAPASLGRYYFSSFIYNRKWRVLMGTNGESLLTPILDFDFETEKWSQVGFIDVELARASGCDAVIDSRFVVYGGSPVDTSRINTDVSVINLETLKVEYSGSSSSWSSMPFSVPSRKSAAQGFSLNGRLYCQGGFSKSDTCVDDDVWGFNLATKSWDAKSTSFYPIGRGSTSLVSISKNRLLLFGGSGCRKDAMNYNDVWIFDTSEKMWSKFFEENGQTFPSARGDAIHIGINDTLLVFGGNNGGLSPEPYYWSFDTEARLWSKLTVTDRSAYPPHSRCALSPHRIREKIYLWGGTSSFPGADVGYVHVITQGLDGLEIVGFKPTGKVPKPRSYFSSFEHNRHYCIFGGVVQNVQNDIWCLDAGSRTWSKINVSPNSAVPSLGYSSFGYNGRLFVTNGYDGSKTVTDIWTFDLLKSAWTFIDTKRLPSFWYSAGAVVGNKFYVFGGSISNGFGNRMHSYEIKFCEDSEFQLAPGVYFVSDGSGAGRYFPGTTCRWMYKTATHFYLSNLSLAPGDTMTIKYEHDEQEKSVILEGYYSQGLVLETQRGFIIEFHAQYSSQLDDGFSARVFVCPEGNIVPEPAILGCTCPQNTYRIRSMECVTCPLGTSQPMQNQTFCIPEYTEASEGYKNDWVLESKHPHPRMSPLSTVVSGVGYILGGYSFNGASASRLYFEMNEAFTINNLDFHTWNKIKINGNTPMPRDGSCLVALDSRVVLIGGYEPISEIYLNDVYVLDTVNLIWEISSNYTTMPPRSDHSCTSFQGNIYITGGSDKVNYYGDLWEMTPNGKYFLIKLLAQTAELARASFIQFLYGYKLFVFGGVTNTKISNKGIYYNFENKKLVSVGAPSAEYSICGDFNYCNLNRAYSVFATWNGKLYIFGGVTQIQGSPTFTSLSDIACIDLETWVVEWYRAYDSITGAKLPFITPPSRFSGTAIQIRQNVLLFGGVSAYTNSGVSCILSESWIWDTHNTRWKDVSVDHYPNARRQHSMTSDGNNIYLFGGYVCRETEVKINDFWIYHSGNKIWEIIHREGQPGSIPFPRGNAVLLYYNRNIFLVGGEADFPSIETWIFNLDIKKWSTMIMRSPKGRNPLYANQPNQRSGIAGASFDDVLYMWGGRPSYMLTDVEYQTVFVMNMTAKNLYGDYRFNSSAPSIRFDPAVFILDYKVWIYGGYSNEFLFMDEMWQYEPGNKRWNLIELLVNNSSPGVSKFSFGLSHGKLVLFGGYSDVPKNQLFAYSTDENIWIPLNPSGGVQRPVYDHKSATIHERLYFFGGSYERGLSDQLSSYELGYCSKIDVIDGFQSIGRVTDGSFEAFYLPNSNCTWVINNVDYLLVDLADIRRDDSLSIYDSKIVDPAYLVARFDGTESTKFGMKDIMLSRTGGFCVNFVTNEKDNGQGFSLSYYDCPINGHLSDNLECVCNDGYFASSSNECTKCTLSSFDENCRRSQKEAVELKWVIGGVLSGSFMMISAAFIVVKKYYANLNRRREISRLSAIDRKDIELIKFIGKGPIFEVYDAQVRGSRVALKKLVNQKLGAVSLKRFCADLEMTMELRHPNIALYMGCCLEYPHLSILFEFSSRGTLHDVLHKSKIKIELAHKFTFSLEVAKGMQFLHLSSPAIIHRNLSSLSINVDDKFNLKIGDMQFLKLKIYRNIALLSIQYSNENGGRNVINDIFYCAPEILKGGEYSTASDVFSFAIVCWEIFSQQQPYIEEEVPHSIACRVINEGLRPRLSEDIIGEDVPYKLKELIASSWNENDSYRPTFSDIAAAIQPLCETYRKNQSPTSESIRPKAPFGELYLVSAGVESRIYLWENAPEEMNQSVILLYNNIKRLIGSNGGYEAKCDNTSFLVVFQEAESALSFCFDVQSALLGVEWPLRLLDFESTSKVYHDESLIFNGLRIAMGIAFGAPIIDEDPIHHTTIYTGDVVIRAEKFKDIAYGGQILVSEDIVMEIQESRYLFQGGAPVIQRSDLHIPDNIQGQIQLYEVLPATLVHRNVYLSSKNPKNDLKRKDSLVSNTVSEENRRRKKFHWEINMSELEIDEACLGSGSFGSVYRGKYKGTEVAVKRLIVQQLRDQTYFSFVSEINIMRKLQHPNIVTFVAASIKPDNRIVLLEYIQGGNLMEFLQSSASIPVSLQRQILEQICDAMNYLHSQKPVILHRDLKSSNVMLTENLFVKLVDFGMSRVKSDTRTMTQCGTPAWLAPEIFKGSKYNEKADVFSFGIVVWEVASRKLPYANISPFKLGLEVLNGRRPIIPPDCDLALSRIMQSCWDGSPESRPSFGTVLTELKNL